MTGSLAISLNDPRKRGYNQTLYVAKDLFVKDNDNDDIIDVEDFVSFCKSFARAYGWSEATVEYAFKTY